MSVPLSTLTSPPACIALPATAADGAVAEVLLQMPAGEVRHVLYWLPALGVSARQYLPLAQALAQRGVAVAIHEWRGMGSSNRRAGRQQDWGYRELLQDDVPAGLASVRRHLPRASYAMGGHSLGGQLSSLYASLHPHEIAALLIVASGSPYWRQFRYGRFIRLAFHAVPLMARLFGRFPGRRLGFGGNEARGVMTDWARSGLTGRYAAQGMSEDFEQRLGELDLPVLALRLCDDWLAPEASLACLLAKMRLGQREQRVITSADLDGKPADHFSWMKTPAPIAWRVADWFDGVAKGAGDAGP
ncbi:alpha/beta fold hydrolase [Dyella halodurans]|nr:alpha/beta fold hydrolase [Dyella halodurans]